MTRADRRLRAHTASLALLRDAGMTLLLGLGWGTACEIVALQTSPPPSA